MADRHPRRSARLAKLKENDDEEKRASRNEIHLFHFRYDFFCRPTELAANLSSFKSINDRTDRKFRHERLTSSRRMFSESEKKVKERKADKYNAEPFEECKGGQNELRCYHVIMHVYCNSYNRMAKMKEWEWKSATNWSNWNSGNYDEKII